MYRNLHITAVPALNEALAITRVVNELWALSDSQGGDYRRSDRRR